MSENGSRFVEVPSPGLGHKLAEDTGRLVLDGLENEYTPTPDQIAKVLSESVDDSWTIALLDPAETVIGTGGVRIFEIEGEDLVAFMVNVAVSRAHRRQGIGSQVVSFLEGKTAELGVSEINLKPVGGAAPFYESLGYTEAYRPYAKSKLHVKAL